ncbi:WXG100 family type VII secretion target [Streptomyces sp. NPDC057654]|uniref:WXG100 family type VII secretion target n=1 Tax=Streptomyces sp. NPDC057654 TaxID=3346196 RepID=UPI0036749729
MAPKTLTPAEFKVDLEQLEDAIQVVQGRTASIENAVMLVNMTFNIAETHWHSPAAATFSALQREFTQNAQQLVDLLHEMKRRMDSAYTQYQETEHTNTHNFEKKH